MPTDHAPVSAPAPAPTAHGVHAYDLFNGDADGLCALHQLRLVEPRDSFLISGVKRDISLFDQLPSGRPLQGSALDISWDRNAQGVCRVLNVGGRVAYFAPPNAKNPFPPPQ